tara:strand:+ start:4745 stop:6019 length:1275 start_codon:yes stop_codon:yes gene_type:complete
MTISDMPLSPSGVGTQTRYVIEGLLRTGRYKVISLGGAIKHPHNKPIKTEEYKDDWTIFPVEGYGNQDIVRSMIRNEKPDILWFMTDPRFWGWLWEMENEIRPLMPMVYYHVWDNYPYPTYNKAYYESNDFIATISKVTDDIVKTVAPKVMSQYVPHAVNSDIFRNLRNDSNYSRSNARKEMYGIFPDMDEDDIQNKFICFWNNRNARRKQSGSLLFWFKKFLDKVGHDKATLIMHTEPKDPHGQDLIEIVDHLGLQDGQVLFSTQKMPPEQLAGIYNAVDCTINISDAEGFGLSTLESLSCEVPIIVNMTGGLQEQVTDDGGNWFGIGIEPSSKSIIGSQEIPWIREDRINENDFIDALTKMYEMKPEERTELGVKGRQHVIENYNFANFVKTWDEILTNLHTELGSWDTRRGYNNWYLEELK